MNMNFLENEIESWKAFKGGLRTEDQKVFNKLMNYAREHSDASSLSLRPNVSELLFLSFAIEQEKKIESLGLKIRELEGMLK